jgi:hypothetical protein
MRHRSRWTAAAVLTISALVSLEAASVTRQNADVFAQKVALIRRQSESGKGAARRTALTQDEVNSWFAFQSDAYLPNGILSPEVTIVGQGKVAGNAVVDLEAIAKRRASGGGSLNPWNLVGGRVPVTVEGILHTRDGMGRFEVQSAEISGLPVPATFLQELVSYYSRTPERPQGVRLDETFPLPANIRQIEVGQGQAVVVQ